MRILILFHYLSIYINIINNIIIYDNIESRVAIKESWEHWSFWYSDASIKEDWTLKHLPDPPRISWNLTGFFIASENMSEIFRISFRNIKDSSRCFEILESRAYLSVDGCEPLLAARGWNEISQTLGQDRERINRIVGRSRCTQVVRSDDAVARFIRNEVVEDILDALVAVVRHRARV